VTVNHFEIFGLNPTVDLDVGALDAKYRELSLKHHPDRSGNRLEAVAVTAALNDAVRVLRDPVRRAFYVLKLKGVDLEREDGPAKQSMPVDFLEDILERREQLDGAKQARDAKRVRALAAEVEALSGTAFTSAQSALRLGDVQAATAAMAKVRYFARFLEEVEAIEEAVAS
jgi:molecular chaperone HscB